MRSPCAAIMETARELLDHGVFSEGSKELSDLRRCANTCGCEEWQDCREQTAGTWRRTNPEALPRPARGERASVPTI